MDDSYASLLEYVYFWGELEFVFVHYVSSYVNTDMPSLPFLISQSTLLFVPIGRWLNCLCPPSLHKQQLLPTTVDICLISLTFVGIWSPHCCQFPFSCMTFRKSILIWAFSFRIKPISFIKEQFHWMFFLGGNKQTNRQTFIENTIFLFNSATLWSPRLQSDDYIVVLATDHF